MELNTKELDAIIEEAIKPLKDQSDFELRDSLRGCGITACIYAKQFYPVGTDEYSYLYSNLYEYLSGAYDRAKEGTKNFCVNIQYKAKGNSEIFGYSANTEERTEEEVKMRINSRKFTNLRTGRPIKPIFVEYKVTES